MYELRSFEGPLFLDGRVLPTSAFTTWRNIDDTDAFAAWRETGSEERAIYDSTYPDGFIYYDSKLHTGQFGIIHPIVLAHEEGHLLFKHGFHSNDWFLQEFQADIYALSKLGPDQYISGEMNHAISVYHLYAEAIRKECRKNGNREMLRAFKQLPSWVASCELKRKNYREKITYILGEFTQERAEHYVDFQLEKLK